ncbi:hypothetical protein MJO55_23595 [Mycolicibacterium rufum]|uniref:Uncharacterized protein n=1 Tax=Mycolicibacterium rufum TaxID=318424 RepID=A0A9X2Y9N1_9MYCO|nr:hypothetical protein [Mycolicibacterium rufum]KGI69918.1 hypothetical protein EU78_23525 [Mycolicibacterium rufum]MCV7069439.1 hypothetical protein [Mycolicibacterium rufum]ULP36170.1 hypothetical protein MJO55_23595 [Mycolicibacterium rufum]
MRKYLAEHQRVINGLALLSGIAVLLITGLRFLPPAFPHADVIGDLFFNLAVGFLGAWLFNLLVIEIPRHRQRSEALKAIEYRFSSLASTATEIRTKLSAVLGEPVGDDQKLMLACLHYDDAKRPDLAPPDVMIREHYDRKSQEFAQIDALALMYFDIGLHVAAEKVLTSSFFKLARDREADWLDERHLATMATSLGTLAVECQELSEQLEAARISLRS